MLLKAVSAGLLFLGIVLAFAFPFLVHARPAHSPQFALGVGVYLIVMFGCFVGASVCALFIVRQVRESFRDQTRANMEFLLESTLRQHQARRDGDDAKP